ncbi:protein TIFY 10B-like [Rhododendron vialii]|uniref:protein TIFY 10B-like n=1 Tax=Rhododendron vialii TaxID=182163 RepID=UPI00265FAE61|nr:protein TIFY 10B-like [Rhododendron vialii]
MSGSRDFSDLRSSGKAPEKSSFAQTCNRLSQFIKEKGSLRDLGLEIAGKLEPKGRPETPQYGAAPAIDLFPNMEKPAQYELLDLFPQHTGTGFPSNMEFEGTANAAFSELAASMETEPKTAPLTIFYGGKVFVFDNFPADKVGEIMLLGRSSENCPSSSGLLSTPTTENFKTSDSKSVAIPGPTADIPIARRASLHRFFDKRKERVASTAPYQAHGGPSTSSLKHKEPIDLNL